MKKTGIVLGFIGLIIIVLIISIPISNDYYIVYSRGKGNSLFSDLDIRGH